MLAGSIAGPADLGHDQSQLMTFENMLDEWNNLQMEQIDYQLTADSKAMLQASQGLRRVWTALLKRLGGKEKNAADLEALCGQSAAAAELLHSLTLAFSGHGRTAPPLDTPGQASTTTAEQLPSPASNDSLHVGNDAGAVCSEGAAAREETVAQVRGTVVWCAQQLLGAPGAACAHQLSEHESCIRRWLEVQIRVADACSRPWACAARCGEAGATAGAGRGSEGWQGEEGQQQQQQGQAKVDLLPLWSALKVGNGSIC